MSALFDELRIWETQNVGELQFARSFAQIVTVIRDFKLPLPTVVYEKQETNILPELPLELKLLPKLPPKP